MAVIHRAELLAPAFVAGFRAWVLDYDREGQYQTTMQEALAYSFGTMGITVRQEQSFSRFLYRSCFGQNVAEIIGFLDGFEGVGDNFEWQHHEELAGEYETYWRIGNAIWQAAKSGAGSAGFQAYRQARIQSEQSATAG